MALPEDQLEKFIRTILEKKDVKRSEVYNEQSLKEIAFEMGYTQGDWDNYLAGFEKQLEATRAFLQHNNVEDAMPHLQRALKLNPYSLEANALLAEIHKETYLKNGQKSAKEKAIAQAQKCLQIDSGHAPSYKLISLLKQKQKRKTTKWIFAAVAALLVVVALVFWVTMKAPSTMEAVSTPEISHTERTIILLSPEDVNNQNPEITVKLQQNSKSDFLNFEITRSELNIYTDAYSYKIQGYIEPLSKEISALKLEFVAFDRDNKRVFSNIKDIVWQSSHTFRPGDQIPLYFLEHRKNEATPEIKTIQLSVYSLQATDAPDTYETSDPVVTSWAKDRPANFDAAVRQRLTTVTPSGDKCYYKLILEAENTGNQDITHLHATIEWYDTNDQPITTHPSYFNTNSNPPIKRGQTRIISGTYAIPRPAGQVKTYRIKLEAVK